MEEATVEDCVKKIEGKGEGTCLCGGAGKHFSLKSKIRVFNKVKVEEELFKMATMRSKVWFRDEEESTW